MTSAFDLIRLFSFVETILVAAYLLVFAAVVVAIIAVVVRVPTMLWSPTEATCAVCGTHGWCQEMHGEMLCPKCQMEVRPAKRWWEL